MEVNFDLLPHQRDFVLDFETPLIGFVGGFRSGKSEAACRKAILLSAIHPGKRGVLLSPTHGMTQRNLVPILKKLLIQSPIKCYGLDQRHPEAIELRFGKHTSEIWLMSAENHDRVNGMSLAWGGFDETDKCSNTTVALDAWHQLISRLSDAGDKVAQAFATSTPEGFAFMYKFFVENPPEGVATKLYRARTQDNFLLPPTYVDNLRAIFPANKIEAYLNGEFVNLYSHTVYPNFDRTLNHTDLTLKDFPKSVLHIGLDFNIGKMAAVVHVIDQDGNPLALDEIFGVLNTDAMIDAILTRYKGRQVIAYPDASAKDIRSTSASVSDLAKLSNIGIKLDYPNRNPLVKDRVASVNAMLHNGVGQRRYRVNTRQCPNYTRCLEQQAYRNGEPDKTADLDHLPDAGGYFIHRKWPIVGHATIRTS